MNINEFTRQFPRKMEELNRFVKEKVPDVIGVEAVNHYKKSFSDEGFTDKTLEKWKDVKRRDPGSPWYGFVRQEKGRKKQFSQARATAKILTGGTNDLSNAITYKKHPGLVVISNDKKYAAVHNYGGTAKIFGKKSFKMPKRQFMGKSVVLAQNINAKVVKEMIKILKK